MMHFAATGAAFIAVINAAVAAFTNYMVSQEKDGGKVLFRYDATQVCVVTADLGETTEKCNTYVDAKKQTEDNGGKWEENFASKVELAGVMLLVAFIFAVITFLAVAAATGAKLAPALDAAQRKLIFFASAGLGAVGAIMSLVGWAMLVEIYTNPENSGCKDGDKCSMAERHDELMKDGDEKATGLHLAEGFGTAIVAFVFLLATAGLSGVAGTQEEEDGKEASAPAEVSATV